MTRRIGYILVIFGLVLLILAFFSARSYPRRRPVNVTVMPEDAISVPEPSDHTVVVLGRVTDKETGELIENATTVVVTVAGSYLFRETATWRVQFPAKSVVDIRVEAPGYEQVNKQLKAHYDRNVPLDIEIKLEPEPGPET